MKIRNKQLNERYKKLKQSDRMEYLEINSIYEKKDNSFSQILFILLGMKTFLLFIVCMLAIGLSEGGASTIGDILQITIGQMLISIFITIIFLFVEIGMIILVYLNDRLRNKNLEDFLSERNV